MRAKNRQLILFLTVALVALATLQAWEKRGDVDAPAETETVSAPAPAASTPAPTAAPTQGSPLRGGLLISEIMEKNKAVLPDEDGDFSDWVELYNATGDALELEGFRLADREDREGWSFPAVRLESGERLLLFASGKDRAETLHTDFSLSGKDVICLYDREGGLIDKVACPGAESDVALQRGEDGSWTQSLYPTPGLENTRAGYEAFQEQRFPAGPLVINEAMVTNFGVLSFGSDDDPDWVEIKNISDEPVQLENYFLSDKDDDRLCWRFPEGRLSPGSKLLVLCEPEPDPRWGSTPCTGYSLDSMREQLYLSDSEGTLLDYVSLRDIPNSCSYGRADGAAGFFFFAKPTPGSDNAVGLRTVSATPVSPTKDGVFEGVESLTAEVSGVGTLRYTLNGGLPTEESPEVTGPIEITKTCVLRVRSFEDGAMPSRTLNLSFILNAGHDLPVVSLCADAPKDFINMYETGSKGYEHPGAISFYPPEGESFTMPCGVSIHGETSRVLTKKNLAVHFRGAYGQDTLDCDIFGGGVTQFSDLLLRAGQDQFQTVLRNELAHQLVEQADTAVINQRCRYCALYINGEYYGLYTLKERPNAAHYAFLAGVDRNTVENLEAPASMGSDLYKEVIAFANHEDMSLAENYETFCSRMDVDSLIDWVFLEGYCANTDVTSGNLRYVRSPDADGKWHLVFYDLDATFRSSASIHTNLLSDWAAGRIQVAGFVRSLMKNDAFRDRFLTRAAAYLRGPLSNEQLLATLDRMAEEITPEAERDFARFGRDPRSWEKNLTNFRADLVNTDWCQTNIDALCKAFHLSAEERAAYFGVIDHK